MPENPERPLPRLMVYQPTPNTVVDTFVDPYLEYTISASASPGNSPVTTGQHDFMIAPPAEAVRMRVECFMQHTVVASHPTGASSAESFSINEHVSYDAPTTDEAMTFAADSGGVTSDSFFIEWVRAAAHTTEWFGNREDMEAALPTVDEDDYCHLALNITVSIVSDRTITSTIYLEILVAEIELENGTIYAPVALAPDAYWIGDGHDVPGHELTVLTPQPSSAGVKVTRRPHSVSGGLQDEYKYVELLYSALGSVTEYQAVLTAFGLLSAMQNEITVTARDETLQWVTFNGTAVRPQMGSDVNWSRYFPRDIVILVKELTEVV